MRKSEPQLVQRRALGRGIAALIPPRPAEAAASGGEVKQIPIDAIDPNPYQPRRVFQPERLEELAQSIRSDGLIQPILVRRSGDRYILVVGERRWRAARLAGMAEIAAIVAEIPEERLLEITLIENIQREDLNPIETAQAFERMNEELGLTHEQIAERTGKERSSITNLMRLLKLPAVVRDLIAEGRLSMGHARAIVGLNSIAHQQAVAEQAAAQGLSVRQLERLVQRITKPREPRDDADVVITLDANVRAALKDIEEALGTRVRLMPRDEARGKLEIEYYTMDDLHRIYAIIVGEKKSPAG